jgi:hypothetical protein
MYKEPKYIFQESEDKKTITLFDFLPRSKTTLDSFVEEHKSKSLFYFQKPHEGFDVGTLYSYVLYAPKIEFKPRICAASTFNYFIEKGIPQDKFEAVKDLAIAHNENEVIFPNTFLEKFKTNSILITEQDLSVQIYDHDKLIGHASVVKTNFPLFHDKNLYLLMRFIVHRDYLSTSIKEVLMEQIAKYLPLDSALCLQVFPNNQKALRFFLRRMNVAIVSEKWRV